ncbi:MAG: dipicolinate synthase subunit DpsA [Eubacteriales bacterium]
MREIFVIGGDKRQLLAAQILKEHGYTVMIYGFEKLPEAIGDMKPASLSLENKIVLLPLPYKNEYGYINMPYSEKIVHLTDLAEELSKCSYVVLGKADKEAIEILKGCDVPYSDLMNDEAFVVKNARITAEAAVNCIQARSEKAILDLDILISGYGRVTRCLLPILTSMSSKITVCTRSRKNAEWVFTHGARPGDSNNIKEEVKNADIIINTAPAVIFGKEEILATKPDVMYFELASPPYGIDFNAAMMLKRKVYIESSLPGRYYPESAAQAVCEAFLRAVESGDMV